MGWEPGLLIGDFDSVPTDLLDRTDIRSVERISFSPSKGASDLELALEHLSGGRFDEVIILGVSGGRSDHMLFNWLLLAQRQWPFSLRLVDDSVDAHRISAEQPYSRSLEPGTTLSLLALTSCVGIQTKGLHYPLQLASVGVGSTLGLSNVVSTASVEVSLQSGILLLMQVRQ